MKILDGSLHEELYNMPQPGDEGGPMEPCRVTELPTNGMAYISGTLALLPPLLSLFQLYVLHVLGSPLVVA